MPIWCTKHTPDFVKCTPKMRVNFNFKKYSTKFTPGNKLCTPYPNIKKPSVPNTTLNQRISTSRVILDDS